MSFSPRHDLGHRHRTVLVVGEELEGEVTPLAPLVLGRENVFVFAIQTRTDSAQKVCGGIWQSFGCSPNCKGLKKVKNAKTLKISQSFLAIFGQITGHNDTKICTVHHFNIPYKCSFIKMSPSWKKIGIENRPNNSTTTTTNHNKNNNNLTVPWSGLRSRQKNCPKLFGWAPTSSPRTAAGARPQRPWPSSRWRRRRPRSRAGN